jgi:trk system potassium uptake protein TrkH
MLLFGINFNLYYLVIMRQFKRAIKSEELWTYVGIVVVSVGVIAINIMPLVNSFGDALRQAGFQVAAIITTTGFASADFTLWPMTAQFFVFILFFIGGCSGSTAGGIKVIRWVVLHKQLSNETKKMLHPHGVFSIRLNNQPARKDLVFTVAGFLFIYLVLVIITTFVGCLAKLDLLTAFTTALSMVGNIGPGFGSLGPSCNYGFLPDFVKWWYCFAMLAGRLELYTMIIFFLPEYWKK